MLLILSFLAFLPTMVITCKGSSGCCQSSSHRPPPPVGGVCMPSACQPGYQCGQYGCARRRILAGLTKRIDGVIVNDDDEQANTPDMVDSELITDVSRLNLNPARLTNPNFIFRTCCESRGLPDSCLKHCHFNTYNSQTLESMFRNQDSCPVDAVNEIHYCAAQGIDHRECCSIRGVGATIAGQKCLTFCDQRPNRFTPIDASYLPCFDVFEQMKRCFYDEIKHRAEAKFGRNTSSAKDGDF
ncbi:unnamed protein product [Auanema sp. JU1783]|nr:unnamed protein product [Auanema sp. JU1783]